MTGPTRTPAPRPAPPPDEPGPPGPTEAAGAPPGPTVEDVLAAATPHVWMTPALAGLVAVCFGASLLLGVDPMSPTAEELFRVGGSFGPSLVDGEWWRLLTSAFLHFGLLHVAFNLWAFWSAGQFAERLYGNAGFLAIYLLSALGGSLLGAAVKPLAVSAGASGAVFGVYGALMAFAWSRRGVFPPDFLAKQRTSLLTFLGYNLLYGLMSAHVSLAAHAGGLVVGLAGGWLLRRDLLDPAAGRARRTAGAAAIAIALVLCGVGLRFRLAAAPEIHRMLLSRAASAAVDAGRLEEALARYDEALAAGAGWQDRFSRALVLAELGRLEEARRDAELVVAAAPKEEWRPVAFQGWLQYRSRLAEAAERSCAAVWSRLPWNRPGFDADEVAYCADVALARGDDPTALARATRLLEASPRLVAPHRTRARLRWRAGDADGALADLDQALATRPGDAPALNQRAWIRAALGDLERARADADGAVGAAPGWAPALGTRCFALAGLGRREEARRDCARAIELAPPGAPEDRGMVAFLDGDLAGATRLWTEAARAGPGEARALAPWLRKVGGAK